MTNPFLTTATGNGATTDFTMGFTMDVDLTYLDVTCTLNGTKLTNFTKISTTAVRFVAPLPSGSLVFERFTPGGRKFVFTPGTRIIAAQVGGEFDRQSADSLEAGQFSWRNYYTAKANPGAYVRIDALGEHEILDTNVSGVSPTWGSPGAIGAATPNTGVFTTLVTTGAATFNSASTTGALASGTTLTVGTTLIMNGTQAQKDDSAINLGVSPGFRNFRNAIINGDFAIWSRQASATPNVVNPGDSQYFADRWRWRNAGSSASIAVSRQLHPLGQTNVPGEPKFFMAAVQTVAPGTSNGFAQRIEDVRSFAGQTINISFYARFDTSRTLNYAVTQFFGTGGAPSGAVTVQTGPLGLTSSWQLVNIGVNIPSISGKTLGTNENTSFLEIDFGLPLTAAFTLSMGEVQVEAVATGGKGTRFERRPRHIEGVLCARYARPLTINCLGIATGASNLAWLGIQFEVPMRAQPTRGTTVSTGSTVNLAGVGGFTPANIGDFWPSTVFISDLGCISCRADLTSAAAGTFYVADFVFMAEAEL